MFDSRQSAGKILAQKLKEQNISAQAVYGITRGGVVVAKEIAQRLSIPLIALPIKKLGAPHNPELALGAVAPDSVSYLDSQLALVVGAEQQWIKKEIRKLNTELKEKVKLYKIDPDYKPESVILTDDGIATGATVLVAIDWLRFKGVKTIILALPVAPAETVKKIAAKVEQIVVLETPDDFSAVGQFYREFSQVTDEDVVDLLKISNHKSQ